MDWRNEEYKIGEVLAIALPHLLYMLNSVESFHFPLHINSLSQGDQYLYIIKFMTLAFLLS